MFKKTFQQIHLAITQDMGSILQHSIFIHQIDSSTLKPSLKRPLTVKHNTLREERRIDNTRLQKL